MEFSTKDIRDWVLTGFKLPKLETISDYRKFAEAITKKESQDVIRTLTNSVAPETWAKQILGQLKGVDNNTKLEDVADERGGAKVTYKDIMNSWLTGSAQSHIAGNIKREIPRRISDLKKSIENELSNIANIADYSGLTEEEAKKEQSGAKRALEERIPSMVEQLEFYSLVTGEDKADTIKGLETRLNDFSKSAKELAGTEFVPEGTVKTESGFIPQSDVTTTTAQQGAQGRLGEPTTAKQLENGKWGVFGSRTGNRYGGEFDTVAQAESYQVTVQSGAATENVRTAENLTAEERNILGEESFLAPQRENYNTEQEYLRAVDQYNRTGHTSLHPLVFGTGVQVTGDTVAGRSMLLDQLGIDYAGLTQDQIRALELANQKAKTDIEFLADTGNTSGAITEEKAQSWLEKAQSEYEPYYTQMFTRAGEDFVSGLKYKTEVREQEMEQEQLQAELARENLTASEAEKGRAFSGIRQEAEQRLEQQIEGAAASSRRNFEYGTEAFGRQTEDYLGAEYLNTLELPQLEGASVFDPTEGVKGALEREKTTAEQVRASELEKQAELTKLASEEGAEPAVDEIINLM